MNSTSLSYKLFVDKILATLLLMILTLGGLMAFGSMLRENNPDLAIPQALITVEWPGAAAEQIEKEVTKPLEDVLNGLKGLKKLQSGSQYSFAMLSVEFNSSIAIAEAMQQLRAKVDEGKAEFPQGVKNPLIEQVSVNDSPVIEYMLYGPVDDYALSQVVKKVEKRLEAHSGVKKVEKGGYRETSVHVRMMPDRLRTLGISPLLVKQRIEQANQDMSWGEFDTGQEVMQLYLAGRFDDIKTLRALPIQRMGENRVVRLEEVALVYKGLNRAKTQTYFTQAGQEFEKGVSLGVKKRPGVDTITLIEQVKQLMQEFEQQSFWPDGLKMAITSDESEIINESFNNVFNNIWQAMLAVFLILMVLLTWREALIAGLAIPLTFLAVLMVLSFLGYTLNTMVIIGMVLSLGLLVDVFILVMEGMHAHMFTKKMRFPEAAIATVKTYAMPAFSGQLTTILAMAPMMAIGGTDGKFIRLIPVTAVLSLVFSYIIAFLVCIPLSQWLLKSDQEHKEGVVDQQARKLGAKLKTWLLINALASRKQALKWVGGAFLLWVVSIFLFTSLPSLLYPKADGRNLAITIELKPDATLEQSAAVAKLAGEFLRQQQYFENVTMFVGKKSPRAVGSLKEQLQLNESPNLVGFSVLFVPKDQREKLAFEYVDELRIGLEQVLYDVPGLSILFKPEVGGSSNDDPLQIELIGLDMQQLTELAKEVEYELAKISGVTDVRNNLGPWKSQVRLVAKPEALSFHGISEQELGAQLRLATEADEYGKFKIAGVEDDLKLRLSTYWQSRGEEIGGPKSVAEISLINIFSPQGEVVSASNLTDYQLTTTPPVFTHSKTKRAITVMAKVDGITVNEVLAQLQPVLEQNRSRWPEGYEYHFAGEAESSAETYGSAGVVFVLAIFMVFAVLTLSLNSFRLPVVIILTIPLALIGTFSGFWLLSIPFSFPAMIGLIALVGIVVNNAIVMVDTMNAYVAEGKKLVEAAASGAADRLRPIVGTTMTTMVGLIPLALSDPMWYPLCMAIILGLLASTLVAMVVIPAMYMLISASEPAMETSHS